MEDYGKVLDFLPYGKSTDKIKTPIAYVLGEQQFTLLEVIPKKNVELKIEERIYVGKDINLREKIEKINRRVDYSELSSGAKDMLEPVVKSIVKSREQDFVKFYNNVKPLNIRMHQLELLPGIGKKHLEDFLTERAKMPFASFDDIKKRISQFPDPVHIIVQRILTELTEKQSRYYLFVRPFVLQNSGHERGNQEHRGFRSKGGNASSGSYGRR